ncbi:hypothetical protein M0R45_035491 [Rubus argutus]|uniref:Leucine carboxyl methyltransferase 1 homolog n=1 Tax=Rubus argutus TaxID=59490 RepID=A0AAW1VUU4_RUBAR
MEMESERLVSAIGPSRKWVGGFIELSERREGTGSAEQGKEEEARDGSGHSDRIEAVQPTNDDASASKLSCVKKGYMKTICPFFLRRPVRRLLCRWAALRKLLNQFLDTEVGEKGQLKNRYSLELALIPLISSCRMKGKRHIYMWSWILRRLLERRQHLLKPAAKRDKISATASISLHFYFCRERKVLSDHYKLLPVDLRDIHQLNHVIALAGMDPSLPTFIIAECVLIYIDPESSRAIVGWASKTFSTAIFFLYEQIHPDDAFGQQ